MIHLTCGFVYYIWTIVVWSTNLNWLCWMEFEIHAFFLPLIYLFHLYGVNLQEVALIGIHVIKMHTCMTYRKNRLYIEKEHSNQVSKKLDSLGLKRFLFLQLHKIRIIGLRSFPLPNWNLLHLWIFPLVCYALNYTWHVAVRKCTI